MVSEQEIYLLGLGDVDTFMKVSTNQELKDKVIKATKHLHDKDLYLKVYHANTNAKEELPVEVLDGRLALGPRQKAIIDFIKKYDKGGKHLDLASSNGVLLLHAAKYGVIRQGVGIELNKGRFEQSKEGASFLGETRVSFLHGMVEDFSASGDLSGFDVVTAGEVLEHVQDPVLFLKKAHEFLGPEGILITTVPIARPPMSQVELDHDLSDAPREHVRYFNEERLEAVACHAGFTLVEHTHQGVGWVNLISVWKKV